MLKLFLLLGILFFVVYGDKTVKNVNILNKNGVRQSNATADATIIHDALNISKNATIAVNVLASRRDEERKLIKKEYYRLYGRFIVGMDFGSDKSGKYPTFVTDLLLGIYEALATDVHVAFELVKSKLTTNYKVLAEIVCTKDKYELVKIQDNYKRYYKNTLDVEIDRYIENDLKIFFKAALERKSINVPVNVAAANHVLESIFHSSNISCSITQNPTLMEFFAKENFEQIRHVSNLVKKKHDLSIENLLKRSCTDKHVLDVYEIIVRYSTDPAAYFAEELNKALYKVRNVDYIKIERIIFAHSEKDLKDIVKKYREIYSTSLASAIQEKTIPDLHQAILLKLIETFG
ncbi:annexin A13-like [Lycorma delicatula]|uniref:annexin A13-like n=1 Tax=Lycorma delicatula TaxID=130591 RepID=UPI003F50E5A9